MLAYSPTSLTAVYDAPPKFAPATPLAAVNIPKPNSPIGPVTGVAVPNDATVATAAPAAIVPPRIIATLVSQPTWVNVRYVFVVRFDNHSAP